MFSFIKRLFETKAESFIRRENEIENQVKERMAADKLILGRQPVAVCIEGDYLEKLISLHESFNTNASWIYSNRLWSYIYSLIKDLLPAKDRVLVRLSTIPYSSTTWFIIEVYEDIKKVRSTFNDDNRFGRYHRVRPLSSDDKDILSKKKDIEEAVIKVHTEINKARAHKGMIDQQDTDSVKDNTSCVSDTKTCAEKFNSMLDTEQKRILEEKEARHGERPTQRPA